MTTGLTPISEHELSRRMAERLGRGNWFLLVVPRTSEEGEVAERLTYSLSRSAEEPDRVKLARPASVDEVVELARRHETLVLTGIDAWPRAEWARWDILRSRLLPSQKLVVLVSRAAAEQLFREAPHFVRLFAGSLFELQAEAEGLSEDERVRLIQAYEAWGHMSTAEMVARAERKELPIDPEYVDWLVLAGRSDLL